jgi:hypothetical protein
MLQGQAWTNGRYHQSRKIKMRLAFNLLYIFEIFLQILTKAQL